MKPFKLCFKHRGKTQTACVYARTLASAKKTVANLYYIDRNLIKEVLA